MGRKKVIIVSYSFSAIEYLVAIKIRFRFERTFIFKRSTWVVKKIIIIKKSLKKGEILQNIDILNTSKFVSQRSHHHISHSSKYDIFYALTQWDTVLFNFI